MASKLIVECASEIIDDGEVNLEVTCDREFNDWFDFADWIKQENLKGHGVVIFEWRYEVTTEQKLDIYLKKEN